MLALRIEFLTGRCVATAYNDREEPEWPPHPARILSALVSTWADADAPSAIERAALDWLAAAPAPALAASEAPARVPVPFFVPVNDINVVQDPTAARDKVAEMEAAVRDARAARERAASGGDGRAIRKTTRDVDSAEKRLAAARTLLSSKLDAAAHPDPEPTAEDHARARAVMPDTRLRQLRYFPSVTPVDPVVHVIWPDDPPAEHRSALDTLAKRVVRVGHSASLVACTVHDTAPEPSFVPHDDGTVVLRVPAAGQVTRLEDEWARHREVEPRVLPCRFQRYSIGRESRHPNVPQVVLGDEWIVFRRTGGARLDSTQAVALASAFRRAVIHHADGDLPESVSGHGPDGRPSQVPHAAWVPLPFVGSEHADGSILGLAIALPREVASGDRKKLLRALARWEGERRLELGALDVEAPQLELQLGRSGVLVVERVSWGDPPLHNLRPETWCRASRAWISATPVALDRNPGDLHAKSVGARAAAHVAAEASVSEACERIGLPRPAIATVLPSVPMPGGAKARNFPPFPSDPRKVQRVKAHALLRFEVPVRGPVIIGAGRYLGLGLFRPVDEVS